MQFGKKFDAASAEKESSTNVSGLTIWNFKAGSTIVRLTDDLEDWTEYWEHYDPTYKKYFPCTGERSTCQGCVLNLNSSHKWLANAFVVSADNGTAGYVNLYKFPKSIITKVMRHHDRRGSLLSDEYEIIKIGQGMDTEYDLERGDSPAFDYDTYAAQAVNHEAALQAAFEEYMAAFSGDVPKAAPARAAAPVKEVPALKFDAGDPPSKPQAPVAVAEVTEADENLTEDDVLKMEFADLVALANRAGLDVPENFVEADQVSAWLIESLGE